jgi:alpha-beta hydrolase superfamily lysophospholipase
MSDFLHFKQCGSGKTVIFLHGFLESSKMWEDVVIPNGIQAIYIDLPGHGESRDSNLLCDSMEEMAQRVFDVIDDLKLSTYKVIGHSMGGYVALALKNTDSRCGEVMLLNSNFWCDSKPKKVERKRIAEIVQTKLSHFLYEVIPNLFIDPESHDVEVKALISDAMNMTSVSVATASLAMGVRVNQKKVIQKYPNSFTIIQGEQDPIVNNNIMDDLRK